MLFWDCWELTEFIEPETGTDTNFVSIYFITSDVPFTTRVIFAVLRAFDYANELPDILTLSDLLSDCYDSLHMEETPTAGNADGEIVD